MALPSFATTTITVITPALATNPYGDQDYDWDNASEADVDGCWVNPPRPSRPGDEVEPGELRNAASINYELFLPENAAIDFTSRVRFGGDLFEIAGAPQVWDSPTGGVAHLSVWMRRVEG